MIWVLEDGVMEQVLKLRMTFKSQPETFWWAREVSTESSCQKDLHKETVGFTQPLCTLTCIPSWVLWACTVCVGDVWLGAVSGDSVFLFLLALFSHLPPFLHFLWLQNLYLVQFLANTLKLLWGTGQVSSVGFLLQGVLVRPSNEKSSHPIMFELFKISWHKRSENPVSPQSKDQIVLQQWQYNYSI